MSIRQRGIHMNYNNFNQGLESVAVQGHYASQVNSRFEMGKAYIEVPFDQFKRLLKPDRFICKYSKED